MIDFAKSLEQATGQKALDTLQVSERVLIAGPRTIVIDNIAYTQFVKGDSKKFKKFMLFAFGGLLLLVGLIALQGSAIAGLAMAAFGGFLMWRATQISDDYELSITTNDGSRIYFTGKNREVLKYANDYVTWKINAADQSATNIFNFNNSQITNSQIGETINN